LIPADIRRKFETNLFSLEVVEDELRLKPVKVLRLSELFDSRRGKKLGVDYKEGYMQNP